MGGDKKWDAISNEVCVKWFFRFLRKTVVEAEKRSRERCGNDVDVFTREVEEKKKNLVPMRIELMTSALLARRSNQLS